MSSLLNPISKVYGHMRLVFSNLLMTSYDRSLLTRGTLVSKSQCLQRDRLVIRDVNKNDVIRGQASWAKMTSPEGKLTAMACHPTKKVNKA
jgi:hypothetical protein